MALANLSWIFSILSKSTFPRGFHAGELYSSIGRTYAQNAFLRISWFLEENQFRYLAAFFDDIVNELVKMERGIDECTQIKNCVNSRQLVAIDLIFTWVENSSTASQRENLTFVRSKL